VSEENGNWQLRTYTQVACTEHKIFSSRFLAIFVTENSHLCIMHSTRHNCDMVIPLIGMSRPLARTSNHHNGNRSGEAWPYIWNAYFANLWILPMISIHCRYKLSTYINLLLKN